MNKQSLISNENKKKIEWPSISVAIATRNSARTLSLCLKSVRNQNYPSKIEIVIADGGSVDKTLEIAKEFKARIVHVPENKQNAEYNKGVAVNDAKNKVLLMIDHDNILPHKNWLKNMVRPLVEDDTIIGSGVLQFKYDKNMPLIDRYSALFGGNDPVTIFFNKSAHQGYMYKEFHLKGRLVEDKKGYYIVELDSAKLPALGGNGSILRRSLLKYTKSKAQFFFHIDIHLDLVRNGFKRYAFVKDKIIHLTDTNFISFIRRRRYFIEKYHYVDRSKRRYSIYDPKQDKFALFLFILYSSTLILPLVDATRGYLKVKDTAWFIHPVMCLAVLFLYGITTIKEGVKNVFLEGKISTGNRG